MPENKVQTVKTVVNAALLKEFVDGKLDSALEAKVVALIDKHPKLQEQVEAMSGDGFLDRLRSAHGLSPKPEPADKLDQVDGPQSMPSIAPEQASRAASPSDIPTELQKYQGYEVVKELGRGGMGIVYLAKNLAMGGRLEVLKVLNDRLISVPEAKERFLREIRSVSMLSHPSIVTAYSVLPLPNLLVFAMEYVQGIDLAKFIRQHNPLPIAVACSIAQQIASGLEHGHQKNLVHRDIKPSNVMIYKSGNRLQPKILDFGLAKATSEKVSDGLTAAGALLGTLEYIAPEQMLDAAKSDISADIYSLGCTLYHMLTGRPPFVGTPREIMMGHASIEAPMVHTLRPDVPIELSTVVAKMMAKEPRRRYGVPNEIIAELKPFLSRPRSTLQQAGTSESIGISSDTSVVAQAEQDTSVDGRRLNLHTIIQQPSRGIATPFQLRSAANKRRSGDNRKIGIAVCAALLFGMSAIYLSGILTIKTANGTLVIENLPKDADVTVDGKQVHVNWADGKQSADLSIRPGEHQVEVRTGNLVVAGKSVSITGEKETTWKISIAEPPPLNKLNTAPPLNATPLTKIESVYSPSNLPETFDPNGMPDLAAITTNIVRLVDLKPIGKPRVGWGSLTVGNGGDKNRYLIHSKTMRRCEHFVFTHPEGYVIYRIPQGARSFRAMAYNILSKSTRYLVEATNSESVSTASTWHEVYKTGPVGVSNVDASLPSQSKFLRLSVDSLGDLGFDHAYWLRPCFQTESGTIKIDRSLEVENNFSSVHFGYGYSSHHCFNAPWDVYSEKVADEYLWAHADSKVTYKIPEGTRRLTCMAGDLECGLTCGNRDIEITIRVNSQDKPVYHAISPNWEPIDVVIPRQAAELTLEGKNLGDGCGDDLIWAYPRFHLLDSTVERQVPTEVEPRVKDGEPASGIDYVTRWVPLQEFGPWRFVDSRVEARSSENGGTVYCLHPLTENSAATIDYGPLTSKKTGVLVIRTRSLEPASQIGAGHQVVIKRNGSVVCDVEVTDQMSWKTFRIPFNQDFITLEHHSIGWAQEYGLYSHELELAATTSILDTSTSKLVGPSKSGSAGPAVDIKSIIKQSLTPALARDNDGLPHLSKKPPLDRPIRVLDLMPLIDIKRDAVRGKWTREGTFILSGDDHRAVLKVPYCPPANTITIVSLHAFQEMMASICWLLKRAKTSLSY